MRDKFTELINKGVAKFNYKNLYKEVPGTDEVCRTYNNIFGPVLDTHMSEVDGSYIITGSVINTDKWEDFLYSCYWGGMNFRSSGYANLMEFISELGLQPTKQTLNSNIVCVLTPIKKTKFETIPTSYVTTESKIPKNIISLTTNFRSEEFVKCFESEDVVKSLNESPYVIGRWYYNNGEITGLVRNKIVKLC